MSPGSRFWGDVCGGFHAASILSILSIHSTIRAICRQRQRFQFPAAASGGRVSTITRLPATAVMQRWWAHMADIMATNAQNEPIATDLVPLFWMK